MSSSRLSDWKPSQWLVLVGIMLVAMNLRPAIVSVSPLLELIRTDLHLTYTLISLLTTIPIFCMGLFALMTPAITRFFGRERGVFWGVTLTGVATAARLAGESVVVLFATTILVGIGIAITQTLLPPLVKTYFPERVAFATGLYTASLTIGTTLASGGTVPIKRILGSWPITLAFWALLSFGALVFWSVVLRRNQRSPASSAEETKTTSSVVASIPWRNRFAWAITLFLTIDVSVFYSLLTWLAPRYVALGWSEDKAGLLLTVFVLTGLVGMFAITMYGDRYPDRRPWLVLMLSLTAVSSAGVAFVPELAPWLFAGVLGIGNGGWFTLTMMLPVEFAANETASNHLSSMALGGGYMGGAITPFFIGGLRDVLGSFTFAFIMILLLSLVGFGLSFLFTPHRTPVGT